MDKTECPVQMTACLSVNSNHIGPSLCEFFYQMGRFLCHNVDIKKQVCIFAQGSYHRYPHGYSRYKPAVHNVNMQPFYSRFFDLIDFFSKAPEICCQDRRA